MKPLLLSLIATALVAAQTGPESVTRASFTSGENQKLYINGGHTQTVGMKAVERPGFFSLDLSTAWSKATPAWKTLDALPRPIRDTDSGKLYGAGACRIDNSTIYGVKPQCVLSTYDPLVGRVLKTSSFSGLEFGHGDLPSVQGVYSSSTKLLYFLSNSTDFAGVSGNKATISQYDDTTRSVKATGSTGETPDARGGACFASAFDGTKIVLAGGLKQTSNSTFNAVQSDVYIFDIATAVWTRLKDAPSAFAYGVCAVSSNHLIIYGGYSEYTASVHGSIVYREDGSANGTIAYNNAISILDLKTNTWVDEYKPSADAPQSSALSVFGDMKSLMYSSALALSVVVSLL
ncbi:hypothetical protein CPC16_000740 [Podila verticillata]|nr:hypothetical protein CPC16_000740 [Podila verticillata]